MTDVLTGVQVLYAVAMALGLGLMGVIAVGVWRR